MEQFKLPPSLCLTGNRSDNWRSWERSFRHFIVASGACERDENVKIAIFLHTVGDDAVEVYNTLTVTPEGEQLTLEDVLQAFKHYCRPQKNVVLERYQFWSHQMTAGASVDGFITELRHKSKDCEFGLNENDMLRDKLVFSITDSLLKSRLLQESGLTFHRAIEICRATEQAKTLLQFIKSEQAQEDVPVDPGSLHPSCSHSLMGQEIKMDQTLQLRVAIDDDDMRKVILKERPESIEDLKAQLKENLSLPYDFRLQYEDPDFNAFCNLTQVSDLPQYATLKVIPFMTLNLQLVSSPSEVSDTDVSTADTEHLSPPGSPPLLRSQWPEVFHIPLFSLDVEYKLKHANLSFIKDDVRLTPSKDMKHDILEKLAETMYSFKAYPEDANFSSVAKALINKHPCLTEPGPQPRWFGWKNSLKFKMANYRTKLRRAGCDDVIINGGKRSKSNVEGESSHMKIKRPKRGEANYLPNIPEGHDETSLENARKVIIQEMKNSKMNSTLIPQLMDLTFSLRRREIVKQEPTVQSLVERWPALFTERQVFAEFNRIASKNLEEDFYKALDRHTPRFIEFFRSKKGTAGHKLKELMQHVNWMNTDVTTCALSSSGACLLCSLTVALISPSLALTREAMRCTKLQLGCGQLPTMKLSSRFQMRWTASPTPLPLYWMEGECWRTSETFLRQFASFLDFSIASI